MYGVMCMGKTTYRDVWYVFHDYSFALLMIAKMKPTTLQ